MRTQVWGLVVCGAGLIAGSSAEAMGQAELLVLDGSTSSLLRVNPSTGAYRTIWSGGDSFHPTDVILGPDGRALVADFEQGVFAIDVMSGQQTKLYGRGTSCWVAINPETNLLYGSGPDGVFQKDLGNGDPPLPLAQGGLLMNPVDIIWDKDRLLVADAESGIVAIDPMSGEQTQVFGGDPPPVRLCWITINPLTKTLYGSGPDGVFALDLEMGSATPVSALAGEVVNPMGMALLPSGELVVTDPGAQALFIYDSTERTGVKRLNLYPGFAPLSVAVIPEPGTAVGFVLGLFLCAMRRCRKGDSHEWH